MQIRPQNGEQNHAHTPGKALANRKNGEEIGRVLGLKYYVKKDEKKEKKVLTVKERCATIKTESRERKPDKPRKEKEL